MKTAKPPIKHHGASPERMVELRRLSAESRARTKALNAEKAERIGKIRRTKGHRYRSGTSLTEGENRIIKQVVAEVPGGLMPQEQQALATALRRPKELVIAAIDEAYEKLAGRSVQYVDLHYKAAEQAIAEGDNETAGKLAQWAIEHIGSGSHRIVEKSVAPEATSRVIIGVQIGGVKTPIVPTVIDAERSTDAD